MTTKNKKICSRCKKDQLTTLFIFKGRECKTCLICRSKNRKCLSCKKKYPNFNYEGENKPLYCKDCSLPGMIDIKNKKCITCKKKQPTYNYEGENKGLYRC